MNSLLHLRFHLNRLFWQHTTATGKGVIAVFALIMVGVMAGVGAFSYESFRFLMVTEGGGIELALYALFIGLSLLWLLFVLSSIVTMSGLAYYAGDLSFFFSFPVKPEIIAREKTLENLVVSGAGILMLGLPIMISFGLATNAESGYYLIAVLVLGWLSGLAVLMGSLITVITYRLMGNLPRWALILIYLVFIFGGGVAMRVLILPDIQLIEQVVEKTGVFHLAEVTTIASHFLPSYALMGLMTPLFHVTVSAWPVVAWLIGTALLMWGLDAVAKRWYFEGWQLAQQYAGKAPVFSANRMFEQRSFIWEKRELIQLWRELTSASQFVFVAIMLLFYGLVLGFAHRLDHLPVTWQWYVVASLIGVAGYVLATIALRFIYPTMSLEGRSAWLLWSSPASLKRVLDAKWRVMVFALGLIGLGMASLTGWYLPVAFAIKFVVFVTMMVAAVLIAIVQLGIGLTYPNFHESDPGMLSTTGPGLFATVFSLMLVAGLAFIAYYTLPLVADGEVLGVLWLLLGLVLITVVMFIVWYRHALEMAKKYTF